MKVEPYEVWIADLSSRTGNDTQKIRPVVILQSNILADTQPSVVVCPLTSKVKLRPSVIRLNLEAGEAGLEKNSAVMIDKITVLGLKRLRNKIGELSHQKVQTLQQNLKVTLDFDFPFGK